MRRQQCRHLCRRTVAFRRQRFGQPPVRHCPRPHVPHQPVLRRPVCAPGQLCQEPGFHQGRLPGPRGADHHHQPLYPQKLQQHVDFPLAPVEVSGFCFAEGYHPRIRASHRLVPGVPGIQLRPVAQILHGLKVGVGRVLRTGRSHQGLQLPVRFSPVHQLAHALCQVRSLGDRRQVLVQAEAHHLLQAGAGGKGAQQRRAQLFLFRSCQFHGHPLDSVVGYRRPLFQHVAPGVPASVQH